MEIISTVKSWYANSLTFKGKTTRKEFLVGSIASFMVLALILLLTLIYYYYTVGLDAFETNSSPIKNAIKAYALLLSIQLLSGTVRRLNDIGLNKFWSLAVIFFLYTQSKNDLNYAYPKIQFISFFICCVIWLLPSKNEAVLR